MPPNVSLLGLALGLVIGQSYAFNVRPLVAMAPSTSAPLFMSDKDKPTTLTSGKKEIAFDEESGRFYETGLDDEDCIPDEEYCMIDEKTGKPIRLTVEEKERIFLDALQSYYASGRKLLDDAEFDLLKEDLQWNGSEVVVLNRKEAKYLAAMQAYLRGNPIMSDGEFDTLKKELKDAGSKFAVSTEPKCYIDTGICTVTFQHDNFRNNLLYLPAFAIFSLAWLGVSYELIEPIIRINPLFLVILGLPLVWTGTTFATGTFLFPGNYIAYGPCPSCEFNNRVYFGDILGVEGFSKQAEIKCPNCKQDITVQRKTLRASTLPKA